MVLPKYKKVAEIIRGQIADGVLAPGASAPSGAALARVTGYSVLTCRRALQTLVEDGVLTLGASRNARARVPRANWSDQTLDDAKRALSSALAGRRRAAGLTQVHLAQITGDSVTSIGHAETGRLWQSRPFWERVDKVLNANGEILRLHDAFRAAEVPTAPEVGAEGTTPSCIALAQAPLASEGPPTPAIILIVWSDGAITTAPMTRETNDSGETSSDGAPRP